MKKIIIALCYFSSCFGADPSWKVGAKIHFERESGTDYLGTEEIQQITRKCLKQILPITSDNCPPYAKMQITKEKNLIKLTYFEERSRPGIGEALHATLLYTAPRGFCDSETLSQVYPHLPVAHDFSIPPTLEQVAKIYDTLIEPSWKLQISEVSVNVSPSTAIIIAKLLLNDRQNICIHDKAISAGLHMTLVNVTDKSVFKNDDELNKLIAQLNISLQGKQIKIGDREGRADLEFGISGSAERIRAPY